MAMKIVAQANIAVEAYNGRFFDQNLCKNFDQEKEHIANKTNNTKDYVNKVVKNNNKVLTKYFPSVIIKTDKGNTNNNKEKERLI